MKSSDLKWVGAIVAGFILISWVSSLGKQPDAASSKSATAATEAKEAKVAPAAAKPVAKKAEAPDPWTNLSAHIYPGVHVYAGKGDGKGSLGHVKTIANGRVLILLDDGRERWYERRVLTSGYFFVKSNDPALP
jgi:hypothetical protein